MTLALEIVGSILVLGGVVFCTIGGIGLVRLPDFYSRCHAAGVTDSAGAGGVLLGLCFFAPPLVIVKLMTILIFIWFTSTVSTHALAKAAYARGLRLENPRLRDWTTADSDDADSDEADSDEPQSDEPQSDEPQSDEPQSDDAPSLEATDDEETP